MSSPRTGLWCRGRGPVHDVVGGYLVSWAPRAGGMMSSAGTGGILRPGSAGEGYNAERKRASTSCRGRANRHGAWGC